MDGITCYSLWALGIFATGYLAIVCEQWTKVNKGMAALMSSILCWVAIFQEPLLSSADLTRILGEGIFSVIRVLFYLLGALVIVEVINAHKGFHALSTLFLVRSQKLFFWLVGFTAFFISSLLCNMSTSIVMITIFSKLIKDKEQRLLLGSAVVVAVNAGGTWTPLGDLSTSILWLNDCTSAWGMISNIFWPSMTCLIVYLLLNHRHVKGSLDISDHSVALYQKEPGSCMVLLCGIIGLLFVPFFPPVTGLPPFMGVLFGVSLIWLLTDLIHRQREDLKVPAILAKIDMSVIFFYLGLLLSINALESAGLLSRLAEKIYFYIPDYNLRALALGMISSLLDNIALIATCVAMFDPALYPMDHPFWLLLSYTVGSGGSLVLIGSAAGIAFMGLEKVNFMWYLRHVTPKVLIAYLSGVGVHYFLHML
ncbi:MAG: hypothetical protein K0S07_473 [Chlamydiales bacterium]|jgi:Na+/H+ antiporter NhaD/arsenite permease-like protein|nr:hypothetical protein [Chlamydiales bacterium]